MNRGRYISFYLFMDDLYFFRHLCYHTTGACFSYEHMSPCRPPSLFICVVVGQRGAVCILATLPGCNSKLPSYRQSG